MPSLFSLTPLLGELIVYWVAFYAFVETKMSPQVMLYE
jgi:hypothetical protein